MTLAAALALLGAEPLPEPPPMIAGQVRGGVFDPGDFGWMRGRFDDAPPEARQQWQTIEAWQRACMKVAIAKASADLKALGAAVQDSTSIGSADPVCAGVALAQGMVRGIDSWDRLDAARREAQPYVTTFLYATNLAEGSVIVGVDAPLGLQLRARIVGEQMLRKAMGWSAAGRHPLPEMSDDAAMVARAAIWSAAATRDIENTRWLKAVVEEHGWPSIPMVGEQPSRDAWLLVQHADRDPAFQLHALRLMEPLVEKGDVSKRNYAYLYDRIMLKIAGTQRYGTQVTCESGKRVPLPLEPDIDLDAERAKMTLEPSAEYIAGFPPCAHG